MIVNLSNDFINGIHVTNTMAKLTICNNPPLNEFVAKIPLKNIGTVQGTATPVVFGTNPVFIAK